MTDGIRESVSAALGRLSGRLPSLRLGQLLCLLCSTKSLTLETVDDEVLLRAANERLETNGATRGAEQTTPDGSTTSTRQELLQRLAEVGGHHPESPLGRLVFQAATDAGSDPYNVTDEQLLAVIRKELMTHLLETLASARSKWDDDDTFAEMTGGGLGYWRLAAPAEAIDRLLDAVFTSRNELIAEIAEPIIRGEEQDDLKFTLIFYEPACSQAAVGAIGPLIETLLHAAAEQFRVKFPPKSSPVNRLKHLLHALALDKEFLDLSWLEAVFFFRNIALHWSYEWTEKERQKFLSKIRAERWEDWFEHCEIDGKPTLFSMSPDFITRVRSEIELLATALRKLDQKQSRQSVAS